MLVVVYIHRVNLRLKSVQQQLIEAGNQLEEKIRQHTRSLEEEIQRRQVVEEKLIQARDQAESATQAKSEFLSSMSHELRTPLNAILGFTQLIQMQNSGTHRLDTETEEYIDDIENAGHHLLHLVNEVLDLERIESGGMEVAITPTSLAPVIERSISMLEAAARKKHISFFRRYHPLGEHQVLADKRRLQQILLNLLSNAIKFNRDNGEIDIGVQTDQVQTIITISDTGQGITQEELGQLFQPFHRLDAYAKDIDGTGIGLAITKKLTELMNGNIEVRSTPRLGSHFSICLPSAPQQENKKAV